MNQWLWVAVGVFPFGLAILGGLHWMGVTCVLCKIILELRWFYHPEFPVHEGRTITKVDELLVLGLEAQNKMSLQYRVFRGNWNTVPVDVSDLYPPQHKAMIRAQVSGAGGCQNCGQ